MINARVEVCVCFCLVKFFVFFSISWLDSFRMVIYWVVWSLGIADFGKEGTSETDRANVIKNVGLKTSANQQLDQIKYF